MNSAGGLIDVQSDVSITRSGSYSTEFVVNRGTLRKSAGAGTASISVSIRNDGTLNVTSGSIGIDAGGSGNGRFEAGSGTTLKFATGYTLDSGSQLTGAGTNLWSGGTITLGDSVISSNAVLAGAAVAGTGGLLSGVLTWVSGEIGLGGNLTLPANAELFLVGSAQKKLSGTLTNAGAIRVAGSGALYLYGGNGKGTLVNSSDGIVDFQSDTSITRSGSYSTEFIVNQGTIRKSGGFGTTSISASVNNEGVLDVRSGSVSLDGGGIGNGVFNADSNAMLKFVSGYALGSGSRLTGTGTNLWSSGTVTLNGHVQTSNAVLAGAALGGTTGELSGSLTWVSGEIGVGGNLTVAANCIVILVGDSQKRMSGTLTNLGTFRLAGTGALYLYGGYGKGTLVNLGSGLLDVQSDAEITRSGSYSTEQIFNQGTLRKSGGTGTTGISTGISNRGTIDVGSGTISLGGGGSGDGLFNAGLQATLKFASDYNLESGSRLTGAGTNLWSGGSIALNGDITSSNSVLAGATLGGTSGTLGGMVTWVKGEIGTLTIATNGVVIAIGADQKRISGILTNLGTVRLMGTGSLYLYGGYGKGTLVNPPVGLVDVQSDASITRSGSYSTEQIFNQGTIRKSGGSGTSSISASITNEGTIDVRSGNINLDGGGVGGGVYSAGLGTTLNFASGYTLEAGSQLTGAGTNLWSAGTITLKGRVISSNAVLAGAALGGTSGSLAGVLTWVKGEIGTTTVGTDGMLMLVGADQKRVSGILTNAGTIRLQGSGGVYLYGGYGAGTLINLPGGLAEIESDASISRSGSYSTETIVNEGILRKTAGSGTTSISAILSNNGTIDVRSGTLSLDGGGSGNGVFQAVSRTAINFGSSFTLESGGQLTGTGTNLWSSGTFTLKGNVRSANSVLAGAALSATSGALSGELTWVKGEIGTLTVATNGVLILLGPDQKRMSGVLTNAGAVRLMGTGGLYLYGGNGSGTLINLPEGVVDLQSNAAISRSGSYSTEIFVNRGTLRKSAGAGTTSISAIVSSSGTIEVASGNISLDGGGSGNGLYTSGAGTSLNFASSHTLSNGSRVVGAGTNFWTGGTITLNGSVLSSNSVLAGSALSGAGGTLSGTLTWVSGEIGNLTSVCEKRSLSP